MLDVAFLLVLAAAYALLLWVALRSALRQLRPVRRRVVLSAVVLLSTFAAGASAHYLSRARGFQLLGDFVARIDTPERVVALTFDDGPSAAATRYILDLLAARRVLATFFVVGQSAEASPESLRALVRAGHQIGNHTWTHRRLLARSQTELATEIERTDALIRASGYTGAIQIRPPHGKRLLAAPYYFWKHDRTTVMWDIEPESYEEVAADPAAIVDFVQARVRPGSIILLHIMHPGADPARRAVPGVLDMLAREGYRLVTVNELLALRRARS